jgi:hypothetical protein
MPRFALSLLTVAIFSATSTVSQAAQPDAPIEMATQSLEPTALHLRAGKIDLDVSRSISRAGPAVLSEAGHFVVQLDGSLTPSRVEALRSAGVELGQYLPANAYIVKLPAGYDVTAKFGDVPFVRWVGPFEKSWKVDPSIGMRALETDERQFIAARGDAVLTVALFAGEDMEKALAEIQGIPGVIVRDAVDNERGAMLEVEMPLMDHAKLADIAAVQWVEEAPEIVLRNATNKWILQTNVTNSTTVWDHGLRGEGQVGGHIDGGVRQTHCSFADPGGNPIGPSHRKIVAYFGSTTADSHGTHTAGTFLGDEQPINGTTANRGLAYLAKMAFTNLGTVTSSNLNSKLVQDHNAGASVHSNSWGSDGSRTYITWCRDIDLFTFNNEDDVVLFAVTNVNAAVYQPENAKNVIGVALTSDSPNQGSQCSSVGFAPTQDGRRKPELTAPGCSTLSSSSGSACGFTSSGFTGNSMACPAVAGAALLVRQYFMDGFYPSGAAVVGDGFTPTGALIRATLTNSAVDMSGVSGFPATREGWGRVLLENALYFGGDARKLIVLEDLRNASGLTTGQSREYTVFVNNNTESLKLSLVWTEKEAAVNANPAHINNLNLTVTSPTSLVYRGNVFSGGQSATGGSADLVNNTEQVLINTPELGTYTVRVDAATVNTPGPQGYALVATGDVSPFIPLPTIESITPSSGEADFVVPITELLGTNFQTSGITVVKLTRPGYPDIDAKNINVVDSSHITCLIDLFGAEVGFWDVDLKDPDNNVASLPGGFEVTVTCTKGDVNDNGFVDGLDLQRFVDLLAGGTGLAREKCAGDVELVPDNGVDQDDVAPFVDCLLGGGCP